jgi:hypothetical protein
MTDYAVQRGKSIALFIGNLYMTDVFNLAPIVQICHLVKQQETSKNKFFNETIFGVISKKLKASENVSQDFFNLLITDGLTAVNGDSKFDPEDNAMMKFSQYLDRISYDEHYEFYENFDDFKNMSEKALEVEITILFKDAVKVENLKFRNVYRDLALEIHFMRPNETRNCLSTLFIKSIEQFEVMKIIDCAGSINSCNALGKAMTEFFNCGLLDERVVEHFLNAVKSPKVPSLIFSYAFIEVLKKYRGKNLYNYLDYFKKSAKKLPDSSKVISAVEDYVVDKELEVWRNGKK